MPLETIGAAQAFSRVRNVVAAVFVPPASWLVTNTLSVTSYDSRAVMFKVYHGTNDLEFFWIYDAHPGSDFAVVHRHWRNMRDWFRTTVVNDLGMESPYSISAFWPLYYPTQLRISSSESNTMIEFSFEPGGTNWLALLPAPVTVLMNQPHMFYRGRHASKAVTLSYTTMNPTNNQWMVQ